MGNLCYPSFWTSRVTTNQHGLMAGSIQPTRHPDGTPQRAPSSRLQLNPELHKQGNIYKTIESYQRKKPIPRTIKINSETTMPGTRRICYCPQHQGPRSYAAKTWFKQRLACYRNGTDFEYWKRAANLHELEYGGPSPERVPQDPVPDNTNQTHAGYAQNIAAPTRDRIQLQREPARQTPRRLIRIPRPVREDSDTSHESDVGNQVPAYNAPRVRPQASPRLASSQIEEHLLAENMDLDDIEPEEYATSPHESTTDEEQVEEVEQPPASTNPPSDPESDPDEDEEEDELLPDLLREFFETVSIEDLVHGAGTCGRYRPYPIFPQSLSCQSSRTVRC